MLQATLDASVILTAAYNQLVKENRPQPVRMIVLSAIQHLEGDLRRQLTGPDRS